MQPCINVIINACAIVCSADYFVRGDEVKVLPVVESEKLAEADLSTQLQVNIPES